MKLYQIKSYQTLSLNGHERKVETDKKNMVATEREGVHAVIANLGKV